MNGAIVTPTPVFKLTKDTPPHEELSVWEDRLSNNKRNQRVTDLPQTMFVWNNTLRPKQNGCHFQCIVSNENVWISIKISLYFVSNGLVNNIPSLVQIMALHRSGDKPFSETMMVSLLTHIVVLGYCNVSVDKIVYNFLSAFRISYIFSPNWELRQDAP